MDGFGVGVRVVIAENLRFDDRPTISWGMETRQSVVFILGAGASRSLGFPLGTELPGVIRTASKEIVDYAEKNPTVWGEHEDSKEMHTELEDFLEKLVCSGVSSIDEYIGLGKNSGNALYSSVAAFATEYVISKRERELLDRPLPGGNEWYDKVAVRVCDQMKMGSGRISTPTISFITFNYDKSLEWALASRVYGRSGLTLLNAVETLNTTILHVHGQTRLNHKRYADKFDNRRKSQPVPVDHFRVGGAKKFIRLADANSDVCSMPLEEDLAKSARVQIAQADIIAFLGFGFHASCLKVLGIGIGDEDSNPIKPGAEVLTTAYGQQDIKRRAELQQIVPAIKSLGDETNCLQLTEYVLAKHKP
jgi:hypothetical protein